MAHRHSPCASSSTSGKGDILFCVSGLKDEFFFSDVDKRVFHSTYRATHYLIPSIARGSHLDGQPIGASNGEKSNRCEKIIYAPEASVSDLYRAQHEFPSRGDANAQTPTCYLDIKTEEVRLEGLIATKTFRGGPSPFLSSTVSFPDGNAIGSSKYLEIQVPCRASEFCIEHHEALSTPDLRSEVKSLEFEGLRNGVAKNIFCTMENGSSSADADDMYMAVSKKSDFMPACVSGCITNILKARDRICLLKTYDGNDRDKLNLEEIDVMSAVANCSTTNDSFSTLETFCNNNGNDRDSLVLGKNCIVTVCLIELFDSLIEQNYVASNTSEKPLFNPANVLVVCWRGANTTHSFQDPVSSAQIRRRIWEVLNVLVISSLNTCDTPSGKKPLFLTAQVRLTLQNLFWLLKVRNPDWEVEYLAELLQNFFWLLKGRIPDWEVENLADSVKSVPAWGRVVIAASCYSNPCLSKQVEKLPTNRDGHYYKQINVKVIVQDYLTCLSAGRTLELLEIGSSGSEQACLSSKVGDACVSRFFSSLEERDNKFPRIVESQGENFDGLSRILQWPNAEHEEQGKFASDQSSHNAFPKMRSGCDTKLAVLLEVRDGGMASTSTELPCKKRDEFKESSKKSSSGFPSCRSANKVEDWTTVSADDVNDHLDNTSLENLCDQSTRFLLDFTPGLTLLEPVLIENSSTCANIFSVDEGSQLSDVYLNGNENEVSCSLAAERQSCTPSLCTARSLSFDTKEWRFSLFLLNGGIHERQSREKQKPTFQEWRSSRPKDEEIHERQCRENTFQGRRYSLPDEDIHERQRREHTFQERRFSPSDEGIHERQSREKLKHFAEGFLLRCHIRRQQRRAEQAPPYPPRGPVYYESSSGDLRTKPHTICSINVSRGNNNEPAMALTSSATGLNCFVGADIVIDIVGLVKYIESRGSQDKTFAVPASNSIIKYADMPLIAGQVVISNLSAVIVTIIAVVIYTKALLEGGLAWVGGARAQKEEDN